jgi:hypothetical protein
MFPNSMATRTSRHFPMSRLFPQANHAFHHTLPNHPLTAPTHTPLGVWAGRQLSRYRRAQKMRHRDRDAIKRTRA